MSWLDDLRAPRLCRISGFPGSGKTHLVEWLAAACSTPETPERQRVHALLSAAGLTVRGATWLLADRLGVTARTPEQLVAALNDDPRPRTVCIVDLNRAGSPTLPAEPRRIAAQLLNQLLAVPQLRLVVEATTGTPEAAALDTMTAPAELDLDDPRWTDRERFTRWYDRQTEQDAPFRADDLYPNPGLARLAARVHPRRLPSHLLDRIAAVRARSGAGLAAAVCEAWWAAVPEEARPAIGALSAADAPVTLDEWAALPGAPQAPQLALAARLLPPASETGRSWWLTPTLLRHTVARSARSHPTDHVAVVRSLAAGVPRHPDRTPDFPKADPDRLALLLRHAVRAEKADQLLADPLFLTHADPLAVTTALDATAGRQPAPSPLADAWHAAGPALVTADTATRAALLHCRLLGRDETAAALLAGAAAPGWRPHWAAWRPPATAAATDWPVAVVALAQGQGPWAGQFVAADPAGVIHRIDAATGRHVGTIVPPGPKPVWDLACLPDGTLTLLDPAGTPQLLPGTDAWRGLPERLSERAGGEVTAVSATETAVALGDASGAVHWTPASAPRTEIASRRLHKAEISALCAIPTTAAPGPAPLLVSGGLDGSVRIWNPSSGQVHLTDERRSPVSAVAAAAGARGPVVASSWADGLIRVRHLGDGSPPVLDLRLGSPAWALLLDGPARLVAGMPDGMVCLGLGE